jgi:hypothetical protein
VIDRRAMRSARQRVAAILIFSATVMRGKLQRPCGTNPMPRFSRSAGPRCSIASPLKMICPENHRTVPNTARSKVDLPAPLPPIRVVIEAGGSRVEKS